LFVFIHKVTQKYYTFSLIQVIVHCDEIIVHFHLHLNTVYIGDNATIVATLLSKLLEVVVLSGHAVAQVVSCLLPTMAARVLAQVRTCGICGRQSGTGAGFPPEYFGFPCQAFHRLLHTHHHLSSMVGIIGQMVTDTPSALSLTSPHETNF
jgi:hypothetical protein